MSNICVQVNESDLVFDGNLLDLIHLNLLLLLLPFWCSLLYVLLWSDYMVIVPNLKCFGLKMCVGLVGCCSCQDFVMDLEACCFCLWFFPFLCQIVANEGSNDHVGQDVLSWCFMYVLIWCVATTLLMCYFYYCCLLCFFLCVIWCSTYATFGISHLVSCFSQNLLNLGVIVPFDWLH